MTFTKKKRKYKPKIKIFFSLFLILSFYLISIPSSAYSSISYNYSNSTPSFPSELPLIEDCPVPIDINYYYRYNNIDSYSFSHNYPSCTLLPFVFDKAPASPLVSDYFTDSFGDFGFSGHIIPIDFNVEPFSSEPSIYLIGDADFSFDNIELTNDNPYDNHYTNIVTFSLRDFYCWNNSFDSRLNRVDSEISLSFDLDNLDLPLHSIDVYYSLAGDTTLNYIQFDSSNYPGLSTGDITFSPDMFGYNYSDTIVYIYSADINFWNGLNQPGFSGVASFDFDAHYTFNPYLKNMSTGGGSDEPGENENPALALIPYTTWIGEAISGFMDFELFNGFTLGGIFVTLMSFSILIWFLKLVAGG